jgi:hypothetical protein
LSAPPLRKLRTRGHARVRRQRSDYHRNLGALRRNLAVERYVRAKPRGTPHGVLEQLREFLSRDAPDVLSLALLGLRFRFPQTLDTRELAAEPDREDGWRDVRIEA